MIRSISSALIYVVATATLAFAAENHVHKGKQGGIMADTTGHHHVELVAKDQAIDLYVLHDDGELEDVDGAKATATVLSGGKTEKITLTPAGSVLKGSGSAKLGKGDTVVISLTMPGHKAEQARLTLD